MKIGLISNPRSHANRRSGGLAARVAPAPDLLAASPECPDELREALGRFARDGVGLIVLDGGDGTLRDTLGMLPGTYGDAWPLFALLPSGKTNAVAADVGHFGVGAKGLERVLAARASGTLGETWTERAALEIARPDIRDGALRGFVFGSAAFSDGVRLASETLHPAGIVKGLAVAMAIGGVLWRTIRVGGGTRPAGEAATVRVDGERVNGERHFLVMASTLSRLTPGLRPFWNAGEGPVNWLDIAAPPVRPIRGMALMALGRRRPWMERNGYASGRARRIDMRLEHPFVLDGEAFEPDGGDMTLSASRPIRFVRA